MIDITDIASTLITLISLVVSAFVIPYLRQKVSANKINEVYTWVKIAVQASEQLANAGIINKNSRKQSVLAFLNQQGITLDMAKLDEMIESAVLEVSVNLKRPEVLEPCIGTTPISNNDNDDIADVGSETTIPTAPEISD